MDRCRIRKRRFKYSVSLLAGVRILASSSVCIVLPWIRIPFEIANFNVLTNLYLVGDDGQSVYRFFSDACLASICAQSATICTSLSAVVIRYFYY